MADITIYHNGECSKCRGALEMIQEMGIPHDVRWYLTDPLSKNELITLLGKLAILPSELVRRGEALYTERYQNKVITEDEWLDILADNPILIQRPVVAKGNNAIIARPPQKVLAFLNAVNT